MTIAHIATDKGVGATAAIDSTGANLLVVFVAASDSGDTSCSITDSKGNTWTEGNDYKGTFFWCKSPIVGSGHTVTCTPSYASVWLRAFSGASTSGGADAQNGTSWASSPGSAPPGSVTPSADGALVLAGLRLDGNDFGITIDGSFTGNSTRDAVASTSTGGACAYLIQTSAAAANPTWSYTPSGASSKTGAAIIAFLPSGGGGSSSGAAAHYYRQAA